MKKIMVSLFVSILLLTGCTSESKENSKQEPEKINDTSTEQVEEINLFNVSGDFVGDAKYIIHSFIDETTEITDELIWHECQIIDLDTNQYFESDNTRFASAIGIDEDENSIWYVLIDTENNSNLDIYKDLINHNIVVKGKLMGYEVLEEKLPMCMTVAYSIFDRNTGTTYETFYGKNEEVYENNNTSNVETENEEPAIPELTKILLYIYDTSYNNNYWQMTEGQTKSTYLKYEPNDADLSEIQYSSSNDSVAKVDSKGNITAVASGTATITVVCKGLSDFVDVKVSAKVIPQVTTTNNTSEVSNSNNISNSTGGGGYVWLSASGSKYHSKNNCGKMNPSKATQVTKDYAISQGYSACSKCY